MHRAYGNGTLYTIQTSNTEHTTWGFYMEGIVGCEAAMDLPQQMFCFNMASQKKKHAPTIWSKGISPMSPLHPRKKYGLLKGLLTNHDPLIQRLLNLGFFGGIPYDQQKMPGQRAQLPILDCSVKSILEGMVKSAWKLQCIYWVLVHVSELLALLHFLL